MRTFHFSLTAEHLVKLYHGQDLNMIKHMDEKEEEAVQVVVHSPFKGAFFSLEELLEIRGSGLNSGEKINEMMKEKKG